MSINPAKAGTLVFWGAAALSVLIPMPPSVATVLQYGALLLLVVHMLEVPIAWRHIKLYQGPLAVSILFTLLFGFVHWLPLKRSAEAAQKT